MADRMCAAGDCIENANIGDSDGYWCRTHWDEREAAKHAEERRATVDAGGPWPQVCPRRDEGAGLLAYNPEGSETPDTWDIREQLHNGLRARRCSFCGSLHPDDFMERAKDGWQIGPTDKSYKAYLGSPDGGSHESKFYFQHLSAEQRTEFVQLLNAKTLNIGYPGHFYTLPFFVKPG